MHNGSTKRPRSRPNDAFGEASQVSSEDRCAMGLRVLARIIARQYAAKAAKTGKRDAELEGEAEDSALDRTSTVDGRS